MKFNRYNFIDVEVPVDELRDGIVYVCYADYTCEFKCPCGCGDKVELNLYKDFSPLWELKGLNTIVPSINRISGCMSHFSIVGGLVINHKLPSIIV